MPQLFKVARILCESTCDDDGVDRFVDRLEKHTGQAINRLWVTVQEEVTEPACLLPRRLKEAGLEELWVMVREKCLKALWEGTSIKKLHIRDIAGGSDLLTSPLPATLTYLSLHKVDLEGFDVDLPNLQTLLISKAENAGLVPWVVCGYKTVRVFACVGRPAYFPHLCRNLPKGLAHFAYYPYNTGYEHRSDMIHRESGSLALPTKLRSFTFVHGLYEDEDEMTEPAMGKECEKVGAEMHVVSNKDADEWDMEMWAYSLGAFDYPTHSSATDTSNFDAEFTSEQPTLTLVHSTLSAQNQGEFAGFSVTPAKYEHADGLVLATQEELDIDASPPTRTHLPLPPSPDAPLLDSLNETLDQLAMPVTLPIELQHRILETALPPLVHRELDERVRLCKTFSLVHRTWTPVAQRELHEHFSTTLLGGAWRFSGGYGRLVAAQVGGGPVKRLRLKVIGYAEDVEDTDYADKQPLHPFPPVEGAPTFEEMWVELEGRGTPVWRGGNVRKLHIYDLGPERPTHLDSLPTNLTYLALSGVTVDAVPSAPHVRFFLYSRAVCLVPAADLLGAFQDLQAFACVGTWLQVKDFLEALPSTLLDLALAVFSVDDVAHDARPANNANIALPPSLDSCILVESVSTNRKEKRATERLVANACEVVDAAFVYKWMEEVGELDFEEWALSVGA
ncbi:Pkinase_C domain-containing protein [Rhodotorula toruloides]|nr:Pkinase_C domain-containing protein [Rhodotorula toruloides]